MKGKNIAFYVYIVFILMLVLPFLFTGCGGGGGGGSSDGNGTPDPSIDSDGDGITNYLELNGYTYDYETGTYSLWNGDVSQQYFKSDPMQASTDGDPYSDSMEVSGLLMDRSIVAPGNHPMIPGYPNLIVKMTSYKVTLNSIITETNGKVHEKGDQWETATEDTTSTTNEWHWDVSSEVNCSILDSGVSTNLSYGESKEKTHTTSTVRSKGSNIMHSTQWSLATCNNTTEAAIITLNFQAKNVGTCVAKDVLLTMNLKIGGKEVKTIDMKEENKIDYIEVGQTHTWVEGSKPLEKIYLTFDELRSIETGAEIAVEITQVVAEVVSKTGNQWESIGTWNDYMRETREICAHLFLDLGNGEVTEHLVYADDNPTAPEVTLKDALIWIANGQDDPTDGPVIRFYELNGSLGPARPLNGWYFSMDKTTYDRISDDIQNPDFNLLDTVLKPNTNIIAKAPPIEDWPKIRWATQQYTEVRAYVDDYFFSQSLLKVYFVDKNKIEHQMEWNENELYFSCSCDTYADPYSVRNYTEKIVARNALYNPDQSDTLKWETALWVPPEWNYFYWNRYDTPGSAADVFVTGDYAYVADSDSGLLVIDIRNLPEVLTLAGSFDAPGSVDDVFVAGDYAYVTHNGDLFSFSGLLVIDVSDPENPTAAGKYDTSGSVDDVFVTGDYAYVADSDSGLLVINVSDPKNLTLAGSFDTSGSAAGVFVTGDYAYVADSDSGLLVINVSNPANLTLAGSFDTSGSAVDVFVTGDYAYVADSDSGLLAINVSNPANLTLAGSFDRYDTKQIMAYSVFVFRDYAYAADAGSGLLVIDVRNPANPTLAHSYDTQQTAYGVFVTDDYAAYVTKRGWGVEVISFTEPSMYWY